VAASILGSIRSSAPIKQDLTAFLGGSSFPSFLAQVLPFVQVCFNEVNPLREEREYAVREALERERAAWGELERAARPSEADETDVRAYRERWQVASHALVSALRALKR
jgi:hypothetical protein